MGLDWGRIGFSDVHDFASKWAAWILLPENGLGELHNLADAGNAPLERFT